MVLIFLDVWVLAEEKTSVCEQSIYYALVLCVILGLDKNYKIHAFDSYPRKS